MIILENFCDLWLKSWTGNQPEKLLSYYHEEIIYKDPGIPQTIKGKEDLKAYFQKLLAIYPEWIWQRKELFPLKEGFTLIWTVGEIEGMDLVILNDNKIIRNEVFFDLSNFKKTFHIRTNNA